MSKITVKISGDKYIASKDGKSASGDTPAEAIANLIKKEIK